MQVREGVGTADEAAEATFGYTANGQREQVIDANGNRAKFTYDGHDRLSRWTFPSASPPPASFDASSPESAFATAGALNAADYEGYEYDKAGNRISLRKRDGQYILASYDALNRISVKDVPGTADVAYAYDLRGLQLSASFTATGESVSAEFDNAGRLVSSGSSMGGTARTLASQTDLNGNRDSLTFGDGTVLSYDHDGLNRMTAIRANGGAAAVSFAYDRLGRRDTLTRANGTSTSYAYDGASRLKVLTNSFPADPGQTQQATFAYNRASQIVTRSASNEAYALTALAAGTTPYARNGLNQYTAVDGAAVTHDANGNLKTEGGTTFTYDVENRLIGASGATNASLAYDPLGRLWQITAGGGTTRFLYDGDRLVEERDGAGNVLRKYAHGPGIDEPLVQYEGTGIDAPRHLHADERGSIVATSNGAGAVTAINRYDEYGQPQSSAGTGTLATRFGYTGQAWLPEVGRYNYKTRLYNPRTGRFDQVDTIGYDGGVNLYEYGDSDPVNLTDPSGTCPLCKIGFDFALEVGIQYATTGKVNVGKAAADAVTGAFNPLKTVERARDLGRALSQVGAVPKSAKGMAREVAERVGRNSVTIRTPKGAMHYDLRGAAHKGVKTPHVQQSRWNTNRTTGESHLNKDRSRENTRPMTKEDVRIVRRYLERSER